MYTSLASMPSFLDAFNAKPTTTTKVPKKKKKMKVPKQSVLSAKREQNVGIVLAKLRLSAGEIVRGVVTQDPRIHTYDMYEQILHALPTPEERESTIHLDCPADQLKIPDQFYRYFCLFPDLTPRVECITQMLGLPSFVKHNMKGIERMIVACEAVLNNDDLWHVLEALLTIGNFINGGTKHGGAAGIDLKSVNKVCEHESRDKTSLLVFVDKLLQEFYDGSRNFYDAPLKQALEDGARVDLTYLGDGVNKAKESIKLLQESLDKVIFLVI